MSLTKRSLLKIGVFCATLPLIAADTDATSESAASSIIHRDVAIIGGGASGAYSAVRLREDMGVSIVLIEKESILVSLGHKKDLIWGLLTDTAFRVATSIPMSIRPRALGTTTAFRTSSTWETLVPFSSA